MEVHVNVSPRNGSNYVVRRKSVFLDEFCIRDIFPLL
ncbi:protein of unknown function [Cupriavidus taiwanensis]|nr:protein of unknown function [Cupriavidus taiwanensis]